LVRLYVNFSPFNSLVGEGAVPCTTAGSWAGECGEEEVPLSRFLLRPGWGVNGLRGALSNQCLSRAFASVK
jgi:hypothetical protein